MQSQTLHLTSNGAWVERQMFSKQGKDYKYAYVFIVIAKAHKN